MAAKNSAESVQMSINIDGKTAINEIQKLDDESEKLLAQMKALKDAGKEGTKEFADLDKQVAELMKTSVKAYDEMVAAAAKQNQISNNSGKSLKQLQGEYRQLKGVISNMDPTMDGFAAKLAELKQKGKAITSITEQFKEAKAEVKDTGASIGEIGDLITGGLVTGGFAALAGAALAGAAAIAEEVEQMRQLEAQVAQLTGATGAALTNQTASIVAIGNTFGIEQNELLLAANSMSKQMKISVDESLGFITQGLQAGANANGDFLDQIKEYGVQFQAAGSSADEFVAVITQNVKDGVFSDKGVDVIKEFGLRIREQTVTTSDAMTAAFGPEFTKRIFKGINDGTLSSVAAMKLISAEMNNTAIPASQLQTVIADVFGGPGEDAGLEYLQGLKDIKGSTAELIDQTNPLVQQNEALLEVNKSLARAQLDLTESSAELSTGWQIFKGKAAEVLYRILIAVFEAFNLVKTSVVFLYENFAPLNIVVDGTIGFFKGLYGIVLLIPNLFRFVGDEMKSLSLDLQLGFARVKNALGFGSAEDIARLEAEKAALVPKYKSLGEAIAAAFYDGQATGKAKAESEGKSILPGGKPKGKGDFKGQDPDKLKENDKDAAEKAKNKAKVDEIKGDAGEVPDFLASPDLPSEVKREFSAIFKAQNKLNEAIAKSKEDSNKILIQKGEEYLQKRKEQAEREQAIEQAKLDFAGSIVSGAIQLLGQDAAARKKHGNLLKILALAEIGINLKKELSAIAFAASQNPANGVSFGAAGISQYAIQSGIAIIRAAVSAAGVLRQKFERGGVVDGPRHSGGGVKLVNSQTGSIVGEMEGGEPILSRDTYANNREVINQLLYTSMHRGGAPIFETGGVFSTVPGTQSGVSFSGGQGGGMFAALVAEQRATRRAIEAMPVVIRAEVKYQDIEDAGNTLADIRAKSSIS